MSFTISKRHAFSEIRRGMAFCRGWTVYIIVYIASASRILDLCKNIYLLETPNFLDFTFVESASNILISKICPSQGFLVNHLLQAKAVYVYSDLSKLRAQE
jgi:hypothetical protein